VPWSELRQRVDRARYSVASWVRLVRSSFRRALETWVFTVVRPMTSRAAISGLVRPSARSLTTLRSAGVRLSHPNDGRPRSPRDRRTSSTTGARSGGFPVSSSLRAAVSRSATAVARVGAAEQFVGVDEDLQRRERCWDSAEFDECAERVVGAAFRLEYLAVDQVHACEQDAAAGCVEPVSDRGGVVDESLCDGACLGSLVQFEQRVGQAVVEPVSVDRGPFQAGVFADGVHECGRVCRCTGRGQRVGAGRDEPREELELAFAKVARDGFVHALGGVGRLLRSCGGEHGVDGVEAGRDVDVREPFGEGAAPLDRGVTLAPSAELVLGDASAGEHLHHQASGFGLSRRAQRHVERSDRLERASEEGERQRRAAPRPRRPTIGLRSRLQITLASAIALAPGGGIAPA
jgi:hypothetical protein